MEQSRNTPGVFTGFTTASAKVRIYDYADLNVPMLSRMFDRRCRGMRRSVPISLPASAQSGPQTCFFRPDPEWKRDYAATSVRRLIRDRVDAPLANLFVNVAKPSSPEVTGLARARSASEAFLYRRLETLPATKDCFQLNVRVPIPFDGQSQMEIDFVNEPLRIAIELDGSQHLSDAEAYRRDRRKDRLLQQNGYLVLRFLAEDLGKDLDGVLDATEVFGGRERH
jgi:very-short-patch-repair endonuclease